MKGEEKRAPKPPGQNHRFHPWPTKQVVIPFTGGSPEEDICILTFDRPGSSANIFDRATLEELNRHLDFIA